MVFSSPTFLFVFLPLLIASYYVMPNVLRNFWLLIASLIFYGWGSLDFLLILCLSIAADYILSFFINSQKIGKFVFVLGIVFNISLLAYFKYSNFFVEEFGQFLGIGDWAKVLLPLGISFFTFQKISYLVDVYRGKALPMSNLVNYALYIVMFPQLIAGPIVRFSEIKDQLVHRKHDSEKFFEGVYFFALGLAMKVMIADPLGKVHSEVSMGGDFGSLAVFLGILAFSFQIYFDFAGYSKMAIGLGKMFGFEFPENFNRPYLSRSITEFWRRWHMTLSAFFKEYVYIPLGGNRVGTLRLVVNLLLVFLLTGIWHGANWTFFLWGVYFGLIIVLEKLFFENLIQKVPTWLARVINFALVYIGWVLFQADSIGEAWQTLVNILSFNDSSVYLTSFNLKNQLILAVAAVTSLFSFDHEKLRKMEKTVHFRSALIVLLIAGSLLAVAGDNFHPFLYFRF